MSMTLHIFDFDDTLIVSSSKIRVIHKDGTEEVLDSGEYASYTPLPGDKFDYAEFDTYPDGSPIDSTFDSLTNAISQGGPENVVILTARSNDKPVRKYLSDQGISGVSVQAVGDSSPSAKARYVVDRLKDDVYDTVHVYEDNARNIRAIKKVVTDVGIKFKSTHVQAESFRYSYMKGIEILTELIKKIIA